MTFPLARRSAGGFVRAPTPRGFWPAGCPCGCICDAVQATNAFLACSVTWFTHFCAVFFTCVLYCSFRVPGYPGISPLKYDGGWISAYNES